MILTCFNMYQKWEIFFEDVEKFFDLVLIEEQMLQQKNGGCDSPLYFTNQHCFLVHGLIGRFLQIE